MNILSLVNTPIIFDLIILVWVHWFADFVMQSHSMATNESKSNIWLTKHIIVYTLFLIPFGLIFALINGIAHWITDYYSSRLSSKMYAKGDTHNFFVVIGFDQALHITVLLLSYMYIPWFI